MLRGFGIGFGVLLLAAPVAYASGQAPAVPPEVAAQIQKAAVKTCNDALDQDRFGAYTSIDECVEDKSKHMERDYKANPAAFQVAAKRSSN
jgi:hypothetical protein